VDEQADKDTNPSGLTSKQTGIAGVAAAFLVAMTGLVYGTHPDKNQTASLTAANEASVVASDIKTPTARTAATRSSERPAVAIQSAGGSETNNALRLPPAETVDFIVRFGTNIPELDACAEMFAIDKDAARDMFANWAADKPALKGVALNSVSYSGEMLLTWTSDLGRPLRRAELDEKLAAIKAMPSVRYADPDFTTTPQKGR